jgi:hypothetical protein
MPIAELTIALRQAKLAESIAKTERLRLEELIEKQFTKPDGGEGSHTDEEVKITWKINRTVDTAAVQAGWDSLTANAQKAFRWKADVDLTQFRALKDLDSAAYAQAAEFITSKPAKPSIELLKD